ncbi:unnamed protein product [Gordionus sp. m RMFG-2023]|uniref:putative uncharacterized protein DDB_G0282133 isoform X2 n=1 Tax=Gordionus sp. m RMFG-2023 TaxID=3053472 RepID=UPI0030DE68B3
MSYNPGNFNTNRRFIPTGLPGWNMRHDSNTGWPQPFNFDEEFDNINRQPNNFTNAQRILLNDDPLPSFSSPASYSSSPSREGIWDDTKENDMMSDFNNRSAFKINSNTNHWNSAREIPIIRLGDNNAKYANHPDYNSQFRNNSDYYDLKNEFDNHIHDQNNRLNNNFGNIEIPIEVCLPSNINKPSSSKKMTEFKQPNYYVQNEIKNTSSGPNHFNHVKSSPKDMAHTQTTYNSQDNQNTYDTHPDNHSNRPRSRKRYSSKNKQDKRFQSKSPSPHKKLPDPHKELNKRAGSQPRMTHSNMKDNDTPNISISPQSKEIKLNDANSKGNKGYDDFFKQPSLSQVREIPIITTNTIKHHKNACDSLEGYNSNVQKDYYNDDAWNDQMDKGAKSFGKLDFSNKDEPQPLGHNQRKHKTGIYRDIKIDDAKNDGFKRTGTPHNFFDPKQTPTHTWTPPEKNQPSSYKETNIQPKPNATLNSTHINKINKDTDNKATGKMINQNKEVDQNNNISTKNESELEPASEFNEEDITEGHDLTPAKKIEGPEDIVARINSRLDEELLPAVKFFPTKAGRTSKEFLYLDDALTRCLLKLDAIDSAGDTHIRNLRREAVHRVNDCVNLLESKINAGKVHSTSSKSIDETTKISDSNGDSWQADNEDIKQVTDKDSSDGKGSKGKNNSSGQRNTDHTTFEKDNYDTPPESAEN